jgi:protein-S-isoprenylcysteine O-methyltransferase Ste14
VVSSWRHIRAIVLLPGTVTIAVPALLLATGSGVELGWGLPTVPAALLVAAGAALAAAGAALWAWTVRLFATVGAGTLAPWDPTQRLVVVGPYRHVRNPMISGVFAVLAGEALALGSESLAIWAGGFLLVNHLYFVLSEEPGLDRRFGGDYGHYRAAVPRWIPRRTPWEPDHSPHASG